MSRRPARFTQADLARALRAIMQADARMMVEVLPDGTMRIAPTLVPGVPGVRTETPERVITL